MIIDIILTQNINEECKGMTCFDAPEYVKINLRYSQPVQGVVIIDGIAVKFSFSCAGMDGDIFSTNSVHRSLVKTIVPMYMYAQVMKESD